LADLQRTIYAHSGHPLAEGRAQDRVSPPAKDRRSANCATQPANSIFILCLHLSFISGVQICRYLFSKLSGPNCIQLEKT